MIFELKWDPKITSNDIAVAVKDGVVTLSGFVSSYMEKDAAEKAAKRVYGVRAVANDIQVKLTSTRTDPEIARDAVRRAGKPRADSRRQDQSDGTERLGDAGRQRGLAIPEEPR